MQLPEPILSISARTEKQALDWSLVLASQGIDTLIERPTGEGRWLLVVSPVEFERAQAAIRQYRTENRARRWQRAVPGTELIFDWRALLWCLLLLVWFLLDDATGGRVREAGLMASRAVLAGEPWRLLTATMLHSDVSHLTANLTMGALLLGLAMGSFGPGLGLLAATLAGVLGNVTSLVFAEATHRSLGASGVVMGALGLLTAESLSLLRQPGMPRQLILRGLAAGVLLLVLLGLSPDPHTDVLAHVGGFVGGTVLGGALAFLPPAWRHRDGLNLISHLIWVVAVLAAWLLALGRG